MINKLLIAIWIVVFSLGQFTRLQLPNEVAINVLDIMLSATFMFYLYKTYQRKSKLSARGKLLIAFFFLEVSALILYILPNFGSNALFVSSMYLCRLAIILSMWFILADIRLHFSVHKIIYGSGIGIVIIGFIQYFFYSNLRNLYYLGWDDHLYRLFSSFLDPNFAGAYLALFLIFIIHSIRSTSVQNKYYYGKYVLLVLTGIAMYLTYSRTAILMIVTGTFVYFLISGKKRIAVISMALIIIGYVGFANTKLEGLNPLRTVSSFARIETMQNALTIFLKHPLIGVGFNGYRYEQLKLGLRENSEIVSHADAGSDNSYLFLLATCGLVGTILYFLLHITLIRDHIEKMKKDNKAYVFATLTAFCVGGLFINLLFFPPLLLWVIASIRTTPNN